VLEVSSPGVDRPLILPRHWRRNLGRLVAVRAREQQVTGRIVAVDDEVVALEVAGVLVEYEFAELGHGRVQVEFSRLDEIDDDELDTYDEDADDEDDGEFPDDGDFPAAGPPDDRAGRDDRSRDNKTRDDKTRDDSTDDRGRDDRPGREDDEE
jgi:hypothetical protein